LLKFAVKRQNEKVKTRSIAQSEAALRDGSSVKVQKGIWIISDGNLVNIIESVARIIEAKLTN
jgi:hypothetical protein